MPIRLIDRGVSNSHWEAGGWRPLAIIRMGENRNMKFRQFPILPQPNTFPLLWHAIEAVSVVLVHRSLINNGAGRVAAIADDIIACDAP